MSVHRVAQPQLARADDLLMRSVTHTSEVQAAVRLFELSGIPPEHIDQGRIKRPTSTQPQDDRGAF